MSFRRVLAWDVLALAGDMAKRGHTCVVEIERRLWPAWQAYFSGRLQVCRGFVSSEMQSVLLRTAHSVSAFTLCTAHRIYHAEAECDLQRDSQSYLPGAPSLCYLEDAQGMDQVYLEKSVY